MGRHRHAINVRADGLGAVLGPLARDPAVLVALLVDVDSCMVLDAVVGRPGLDPEELGAAHGDVMRLALGPATGGGPADCEVLMSRGGQRHLVARRVPDPYGDRLALTVLVDGPARALRRVRRRLGEVSAAALTAGPTVSLRPYEGMWVPGMTETPVLPGPRPPVPPQMLLPPSAMPLPPAALPPARIVR